MSTSIDVRMNPQFDRDLAALVEPALRGIVAFGEAHAKREVPVETGNLLRSGSSGVSGSGADMYGWIAFAAFYAIFIELGTGRMAAQPYLRPALLAIRAWLSAGGF